ncbi:hypothetical protein [Coprococcus comes]|uniref:hypothetical protein n=1 Tax=Coprococcus comes TaxID=410072 RepID=UPI003F8879BB
MGQEKDVLIIKSDKKWKEFFIDRIVYFIIWVIGFDAMITYWIVVSGSIKGIDIAMYIMAVGPFSIVIILRVYLLCRNIDRELILDKTGVLVKTWLYKRKYTWDEFQIKQLRINVGEYCYDEALFLAACKHQPKQNSNCELFPIRHPIGSFCINFKMHRPILAHERANLYINGEIMAAEKEELLSKLKEWGVDFETERPKNFDIFQDKKGRLQSRRNGTAWILLAAAVWILLLGFIIYPIFIWKNPVLIAIFIPFFIALVPVYVVVTSRKSYRLKMDEKGCIRKFLFLSKRYPWKDLRVKLVASEESHCGEGVLFIKKKSGKSGDSSSASETFSYASLHPYSSFVANFEVFGKMYGEKDALHEINKELFLKKMKEWGVEVEGLPKAE